MFCNMERKEVIDAFEGAFSGVQCLVFMSMVFKLLVGNVVNILVTYHPDMCCSCISDDIFDVADTVTGSQLWSHVGKIPRHDK